jgi:hypothetical protein
MQNYKLDREVINRADWEKCIKEMKVCIGLQCHLRKRRRIHWNLRFLVTEIMAFSQIKTLKAQMS